MRGVNTTCPYCGVGCGVTARVDLSGAVEIRGDSEHPANRGRLCSKGSALADTLGLEGRLAQPWVDGQPAGWEQALDRVADGFRRVIERHGPDAVAFYVSGQLLTEDYYVANKLMKGFIGSANIDTNSRLCMASSVAGHKRAFGSDTVPGCYEDLELADLVVLIGSNTAWCHPVVYQRLAKARKERPGMRVVVVDPRRTVTCDIADLHLLLAPGTDAILFNGLLNWLNDRGHADRAFLADHAEGAEEALRQARWSAPNPAAVAAHCGLDVAAVRTFFEWFGAHERVVSLYSQGVNQSSSGTDKVNAIINCHLLTGRIGKAGMGPLSITGQPNAMGGREVGALANQLVAHMDFADEQIDRVSRFWQAPGICRGPGLKAVELFEAVADGRVKALWVMATNPAVSLPNSDRVRQALASCELLVVSDCEHHTDTTAYADVLLPALAWGEKDGTVTNSERCISRQRPFLQAPEQSRGDWWIVSQVARRMGYPGFDYQGPHDIFTEYARLSGFENQGSRDFDISGLAGLSEQDYQNLAPRQWPLPDATASGTPRMFADRRFFTESGRARLIAVRPEPPGCDRDADYPLALNTGRIRDQWHTMTRTGKSARLCGHTAEPYVAMHPRDADRLALTAGQLVRVESRWGQLLTRARVSQDQSPGELFAPMHWSRQFGSAGACNQLVNPLCDPVSGQPEFKHTPVRLRPFAASWYGFLLTGSQIEPRDLGYWNRVRRDGVWLYQLAATGEPQTGADYLRQLLLASGLQGEWGELRDRAKGHFRFACFSASSLLCCCFIGPDPDLPEPDWLVRLFSRPRLESRERARVLAGVPGSAQEDAGPVVCSCFGVGRNSIVRAIREQGLATADAIGQELGAGTNCGSCIPELRGLIDSCS